MTNNNVSVVFPDELDIILHTPVPLLGKFYYDPNMSIRNDKLITQKQLIFNPLIKLDPTSLKNIPDYEQRVSHFFNRASFESMVYNYSAMQSLKISKSDIEKKEKILQYNDNKNNNLTFVLDTIFESGQTLYLGGKPFTIVFYKMKSRKLKITNKIDNISGDPNQTLYETRNKLRRQGKENQKLLQQLQDDGIEDMDEAIDTAKSKGESLYGKLKNNVSNAVNNIRNRMPNTNAAAGDNANADGNANMIGGYKESIIIDNNFDTKFDIHSDQFLETFSKFISIQINDVIPSTPFIPLFGVIGKI